MNADAIATRPIGTSSLRVSELGCGTAGLGNLYHRVADDAARATIDAALSAGLTYVDTASYYGFGLSERRVGDAVRGRDVVLSTKVGRLLAPDASVRDDAERYDSRSATPSGPIYDYSYDGVMRLPEASLHRLGLARIDILHDDDIGRRTHRGYHQGVFAQLVGAACALGGLRSGRVIGATGSVSARPPCAATSWPRRGSTRSYSRGATHCSNRVHSIHYRWPAPHLTMRS